MLSDSGLEKVKKRKAIRLKRALAKQRAEIKKNQAQQNNLKLYDKNKNNNEILDNINNSGDGSVTLGSVPSTKTLKPNIKKCINFVIY